MTNNKKANSHPWANLHGPNLGYVIEQYDRYVRDEDSVDSEMEDMFQKWGPPSSTQKLSSLSNDGTANDSIDQPNMKKVLKVAKLLEDIRSYGHLSANINPLDKTVESHPGINLESYGLDSDDLKAVPVGMVWENAPKEVRTAWDMMNQLKERYTGSLAYEFNHVSQREEREWLFGVVETGILDHPYSKEERVRLLKRLTEVEGFEQYLHKTYVGQKRFSIEGVDMLVPMLDGLICNGSKDSARDIVIGMAHRGRLSVLAHVMEKPYHQIFSEFKYSTTRQRHSLKDLPEIREGWTGDVKYHLGKERLIEESDTVCTRVTLANNPSHLEFVNPVVEGFARATQENREKTGYPKQDVSKSFAVSIHGDAAFPGQGIVTETLNLGELKGYQTGGTIHIIANNMVGFTTDSKDSRSTKYASNVAKGFEIPVVHVNADDPEACLAAVRLAYQYRMRFNKSFLIDLVGYRRFGHNEMDDPTVTQPQVYKEIMKHRTVRELYADRLQTNNILSREEVEQIKRDVHEKISAESDIVLNKSKDDVADDEVPVVIAKGIPSTKTSVPIETLNELNDALLNWPKGFQIQPKLKRILERRQNALKDDGKVDWALAEALAIASILKEGTPIRLTGQDSERGTFAQRHIVLHDMETNETYSPLHRLSGEAASFAIHNSPLSEAAVVGFEYGYNVFASETLVMWEAQYGDFANTAQALFDQFVSSGRAKWGQKSGFVLLLPHGYEGQGPEHSSARPERFLQLSAENNWTVANVTSAAQYFHILRRQAAILGTEYVRPLVLMTPKGLLRHSLTTSFGTELSEGHFQTVLEQPHLGHEREKVKRLVLTTGKMAIDLAQEVESKQENQTLEELHIIRIEQLYPFPKEKVEAILQHYPNLEELVWVQEEPKNMGAWHYVSPILYELAGSRLTVNYIGRPKRSSTAGGDPTIHKKEQERIINQTLKINMESSKQEKILIKS